jgi:hypothetical protein
MTARDFCARLLNLHRNHRFGMVTIELIFGFDIFERKVLTANQSEQFRPAIPSGLGDHDLETSTSSLSFRSSELSQPI